MDEMAVLTTSTPVWPMVIATGNSSEIAWLDQHVLIDDDLLVCHLLHLHLFLLVDFLELADGVVGETDEDVRGLASGFLEQDHDAFLLF